MSTLATEVVTEAEKLFPPKPGGMVATARAKMAADAAQASAIADAPQPDPQAREIPVTDRAAELARARTFSVATGGNAVVELLGRDDLRRNAVIMTLDEPVVISFSQAAAEDSRNQVNAAGLSANGFVLPVNVPVTVETRSIIYCTATSSTATRVSVMAVSYTAP